MPQYSARSPSDAHGARTLSIETADAIQISLKHSSKKRLVQFARDGEIVVEITGSGRPLVMIHGWALDRRMWSYQLRELGQHFRVITYDRRGFGESTCRADLDRELGDLDEILEQLELDRVALLGMSQGGRVGLRYAIARRDRVSALILHGAPLDGHDPPPGNPTIIPTPHYSRLLKDGKQDILRDELSAHPLMDLPGGKRRARALLRDMLSGYRGEDLLGSNRQTPWRARNVARALRSLTIPTLLITGAKETTWLRAIADHLAGEIPNARHVTIRGGGHLVNMTHPAEYNRSVIRFLAGR